MRLPPARDSDRRRAGAAGDAVWTLVLPPAERILCHAEDPPAALVRELSRRGACVDVVSRCDLERWLDAAAGHGRLRCLWEPDPDADYDLALLWDPRGAQHVSEWLAQLARLPLAPREIAVWSRNPVRCGPAPGWRALDAQLRRAGFAAGESHLGLPEPHRVRQIVEWRSWGRAPLVVHRRTHRRWKGWVTRQAAGRWLQPVRLRRARLDGVSPTQSRLDELIAVAAGGAPARLERLLVSPNGVAIAAVRIGGPRNGQNAILKVPYALNAEGRVARNAAGLEWMAAHAGGLGDWGAAAPRLLARGRAGAWSWTLEERVEGSEAQSWAPSASARAMHELAAFLEILQRQGEPPRALDGETFERLAGAPIRVVSSLLDPVLARRLHDLWSSWLQTLREVRLPLVPRHGDLKLENVFGRPEEPGSLRILDWELFAPRGLPLLDLWHLIASRRARACGCSMGAAVRRWLLPGDLDRDEKQLVERLGRDLDRRYVELSPALYWLDRIGPVAARGAWPAGGWERSNVVGVLETLEPPSEVLR